MPRRTLLSAGQRARLFEVPTDRAEMARHHVLGPADLELARSKRRAANRLGCAIQLCLLRHPGQGFSPGEYPPAAMLAAAACAVRMQPGRKVPSSERWPLAPTPPKPAASPTQYRPAMGLPEEPSKPTGPRAPTIRAWSRSMPRRCGCPPARTAT